MPIDSFFYITTNTYNLRTNSLHITPTYKPKTDIQKHFYTYRVCNIWNSLSDDIVNSNSFLQFKRKLKNVNLTIFCKVF